MNKYFFYTKLNLIPINSHNNEKIERYNHNYFLFWDTNLKIII